MKKIFVLFCLSLLACISFIPKGQVVTRQIENGCKIYFVDRQMHRLIPTDFYTKERSPEKIAREIISATLSGKDYNNEILRIIPNIENSISVNTKKDTAYINLSSQIKNHITKNPETERLFIYQLVNSVTSIPEINFVQFTIDQKSEKDFLGFLNMREIFTPDYSI